jgi:hypothetical protein
MSKRRGFCRLTTARAWLLGATLLVATACGPTVTRVYVPSGPPAPVYEVRAVSPGPGYIWIEGYHHWTGHAYEWVPGRWERAPHAHATWVAGRWEHDKHGYYYVDGHWRG